MARSVYVVDDVAGFDPDSIFTAAREQVVVAVNVAPSVGAPDLDLLAGVVDEANARAFSLVREQNFQNHYLLVTFDAYDDDEDDSDTD